MTKVNIVVKASTLREAKPSADPGGRTQLTYQPSANNWERRGQREQQAGYERPGDEYYGDNQAYGQGGLDSPSISQYDTYGTVAYVPTGGGARRFNEAHSFNDPAGAYSSSQHGFRDESGVQYGNRAGDYENSQNQYGEPRYGQGGTTEHSELVVIHPFRRIDNLAGHHSTGMLGKAKEAAKELKDRL
ncbi:hypothetical protein MD484_g4339, partial [Candolleomyces efflorescens]